MAHTPATLPQPHVAGGRAHHHMAATATQLGRKPASSTHTTWPCLEYTLQTHQENWPVWKTQELCLGPARGQPTYPQCQRLCSQEKSSFTVIQLTPASSENGENGAVFGHCYLGTFILITEALSNRCLVTNTFEIDLLTYYKML